MVLTYREKYNKKYGFKKDSSHSISDISKTTGYKLSGLKKIWQHSIPTQNQFVQALNHLSSGLMEEFLVLLWGVKQKK